MALVIVGLGGIRTINTSGSDSVTFLGNGTLNVTGTPGNPIDVTFSQVLGLGLLETINITHANVTLGGVAGVSALVAYNIGANGTLNITNSIGIGLGTSITFAGSGSNLVLGAGIDISLFGGLFGFGAGSTIDVSQLATGLSYADAVGDNTGGTITLTNAGGVVVGTLSLASGNFVRDNFSISADGSGGTLIRFSTALTSIVTSPATATLGVGQTVTFTVIATDALTIAGGTPSLTLSDGGVATYVSGASTPTSLVFSYTVAPGQNTADLEVTGASANGAIVLNAGGSVVDLQGAIGNPDGVLAIDTTAPLATGVVAFPSTAVFGTGSVVTLSLAIDEPVTVVGGIPTLTLNNGGIATYNAAVSTPTSVAFNYTVAPGQNTADLAVTGLSLNGAVIADPAGNLAGLAAAIGNPAGILQVDANVPTVVSVVTTPGSGTVAAGEVVTFTVALSEAVTVVGGAPTLTLDNGGIAAYVAGASTPAALVFGYTVAAGQASADLAVTAVNLNGAIVADAAANPANLQGAVGNPAGVLQVDTTAPVLVSLTAAPDTANLGIGQTAALTIAVSEAVTVTGGIPTLALNNGGIATYDAAASTATSLVFGFTVAAGQSTADLTVTSASLNGATIADGAGNTVSLATAVANPAGILQTDGTVPFVTAVATTPGSGTVAAGQVVTFTVAMSEAVTVVGGTPTLTLDNGGIAAYVAGASTPAALVFSYTVAAGQASADLAVTAVSLNGAIVADAAANPANLQGAVGNPAGVLQVDTSFAPFATLVVGAVDPSTTFTVVASVRPAIPGVYSNLGSGSIGADGATYTVTGTAAQVNAALAGVRLSPAPGSPALTGLNAALVDPNGASTNISTAAGDDVLSGNDGDNVIVGAAGADTLSGGPGIDTLSYAGSVAGVAVNLATGTASGGDAAGDVVSGFEDVVGTSTDDVLIGDGQANRLDGLSGNDTLLGNAGADILIGGLGLDTLSYAGGVEAVFVDLALSSVGGGTAQGDQVSGFENAIGGDGSDGLVGDSGDNRLEGGLGNDGLTGGTGADTLVGGDGFDLAYYEAAVSAVVASLGSGIGTAGEAGGDILVTLEGLVGGAFDDTLTGDGNTNLIAGGIGNDTLDGGGGDDAVFGQQGNDSIFGGDGNDLIRGGEGADAIDGGSGFNLAIFDTAASSVSVSLLTIAGATSDATGDTFSRIQGFLGSDFDDFLVGDNISNLLLGGLGNDTLLGGIGFDSMDGGSGSDTFLFNPGFELDHIVGFQTSGAERDVLSFSSSVFATAEDALAQVYTDPNGNAYVFAGGTNAVVLVGVTVQQLTADSFAIR